MEDFKNRLLEYINGHLGISIRAFEEACGLTNGVIASIKVKGPSVDVLMKISDKFPELDMNWLISGRGQMTSGPDIIASQQNEIHHNDNVFIGSLDVLAELLAKKLKKQ